MLIKPPLHANQEEEALQGYIIEKILYQQQTKQLPVMHVSLCGFALKRNNLVHLGIRKFPQEPHLGMEIAQEIA